MLCTNKGIHTAFTQFRRLTALRSSRVTVTPSHQPQLRSLFLSDFFFFLLLYWLHFFKSLQSRLSDSAALRIFSGFGNHCLCLVHPGIPLEAIRCRGKLSHIISASESPVSRFRVDKTSIPSAHDSSLLKHTSPASATLRLLYERELWRLSVFKRGAVLPGMCTEEPSLAGFV